MSLRKDLEVARLKLTTSQQRYKADFDGKIRYKEKIVKGDTVYVHIPPNTSKYLHPEIDQLEYTRGSGPTTKVAPGPSSRYKVLRAKSRTVNIRQDRLENIIFIGRV